MMMKQKKDQTQEKDQKQPRSTPLTNEEKIEQSVTKASELLKEGEGLEIRVNDLVNQVMKLEDEMKLNLNKIVFRKHTTSNEESGGIGQETSYLKDQQMYLDSLTALQIEASRLEQELSLSR